MQAFVGNIEEQALKNTFFRQVIFTGQHSQLVLMSLNPKEEIGEEVHEIVDQLIKIEKGNGKVVIDGIETDITDGSAILIPAGLKHNLINTSETESMKLYTLYSPPHHKDGTVHATKAEAIADNSDHI